MAAAERGGAGRDGEARIPGLDGVRALAVLGVIASHAGLVGIGWLGVDVFFGLSGYLITGILLEAKDAEPTARQFFIPFYMRRALRILPLAWTFAIIVCAYRGEFRYLGWYMSYLVNWLPDTPPPRDLGLYWSVSVEEQFYTLWPTVVFFSGRRTLFRIAVGVIALDIALRLAVSLWPPSFVTAQWRDLASFARADALAVGALLAMRERTGGFGRETRLALPIMVVGFCAVYLVRSLERGKIQPLLMYNLKWPLIALWVGACLLYVLTRKPRLLSWPWLAWLGKISYGIYLIHGVFGGWLHERFTLAQAPIIFAIQVGLTVPLAAFSWYFFESRILRHKWRWPMPRPRAEPAGSRAANE